MSRWFVGFWLLGIVYLHAQTRYSPTQSGGAKPAFFVKTAAFAHYDNAVRMHSKSKLPLQIVRLKKYYCLLSPPFTSLSEAQKWRKRASKTFTDAYVIKLYTNAVPKTIHVSPVPKATAQQQPTRTPFAQGVALYKQKAYEDALALFDRILISDSENIGARFYYAKTLYQLHLLDEAKKAFTTLSKVEENPAIRKAVREYLEKIARQRKKHFVNAAVTAGIGYDDNVNLNTDYGTTRYGPYMLINDTNKTKSTYAIGAFSLTHRYDAAAFSVLSALYSYNEFFHTAEGNDLNYLDLSTALLKKYGRFSLILPVGANAAYLAGDAISYNLYTAPSLSATLGKNYRLSLHTVLTDNFTQFAKDRDYIMLGGGLGLRKQIRKSYWGVDARIAYYREKSHSSRYDINRDLLATMLYGRYYLYHTLYFDMACHYDKASYRDLDSVLGYRREDDKSRYTVTLGNEFGKTAVLSATYSHTENHSNVHAFSYKKNNVALQYRYKLYKE